MEGENGANERRKGKIRKIRVKKRRMTEKSNKVEE